MIYQNLEELGNNTLNINDIVDFHINGKTLRYFVQSNHLSNMGRPDNAKIFSILGISKDDFCNFYYGYPNYGGDWPVCRNEDYTALTRVVKALYLEIEKKEIREIPKYYSGQTILEELKTKFIAEAPEKKESTSSNIITKKNQKLKE